LKPVRIINVCLNETHGKFMRGRCVSDIFPVENDRKQDT